jgi:hypothetical protein
VFFFGDVFLWGCFSLGMTQEALAFFRTELTKAFDGRDLDPLIENTPGSSWRSDFLELARRRSTRSSMLKLLRISSNSFLIFGLIVAVVILCTSRFSSIVISSMSRRSIVSLSFLGNHTFSINVEWISLHPNLVHEWQRRGQQVVFLRNIGLRPARLDRLFR